MKKFALIAAGALVLACSPVAGNPVSAHDSTHSQFSKLQVTGTGTVSQAPDQASVSAGVVTVAASAGEAMRQNARQMTAAFKALKAAGIADRDIQTSQMSLQPQRDYQNRTKPRITGYQVSNTVRARTTNLNNVGPMLDALVGAGINSINGVNFSIKDAKNAKGKARHEAILAARAKAESMANAAGVRLGRILSLSESGNTYNPQPMMMRSASMDSAPTPIAAGEQNISVTVNITYEIVQ